MLEQAYGHGARECPSSNEQINLVFSQNRSFDLVELEQLLEAVGWSRRPMRRVRRALDHTLLKVGLWRHDPVSMAWFQRLRRSLCRFDRGGRRAWRRLRRAERRAIGGTGGCLRISCSY